MSYEKPTIEKTFIGQVSKKEADKRKLKNIPKAGEQEYMNIQKTILDMIKKGERRKEKIEEFEIKSNVRADNERQNYHDDLLIFLEPLIKDAKFLDLFCCKNVIKDFYKSKNWTGEVTGVDIEHPNADIISDVAKIEKNLKPNQQFDIISAFGGVSGVIDYDLLNKYLKDDGLYITESSEEVFDMDYEPILNGKEIDENDSSNTRESKKDFIKELKTFYPIAVLKIKDKVADIETLDKKSFTAVTNDVYIIFKKNKKE